MGRTPRILASGTLLLLALVPRETRCEGGIVIVTAFYGTAEVLRDITWPNKQAYAKQHGYALVDAYRDDPEVRAMVQKAQLQRDARPTGPKILTAAGHNDPMLNVKLMMFAHFVKKWLHVYDWIFWSDAARCRPCRAHSTPPTYDQYDQHYLDCVFLNFSIPLARYLPEDPKSPKRLIIAAGPPESEDWRGVINTGNFFLQVRHATQPCNPNIPLFNGWMEICIGFSPGMIQRRELALADGDTTYGAVGYPYGRSCCEWGDQGVLMQVLQKRGQAAQRHVQYVGFREFNSHFPYYGEGDLVVHLPGSSAQGRVRVLNELLSATRVSDGKFEREVSTATQPQYHADHVRGMNYSALGGSAGGELYPSAAQFRKRFLAEHRTQG